VRRKILIDKIEIKKGRKNGYLVILEGGPTYIIKEELKYQGFRWNPSARRWEKFVESEEDMEDIIGYIKKFVRMETDIEIMERIKI